MLTLRRADDRGHADHGWLDSHHTFSVPALGDHWDDAIDVNGDEKADICGRGGAGIYCAVSNGSGFGPALLWTSTFSDAQGWNQSFSNYSTIRFPDLNGDNMEDVCGRSPTGIDCALSNGGKFYATTLWAAAFKDANGWAWPQYFSTITFPDLNGDGKADVCGRGGGGINCALSNGSTFGTVTVWSPNFNDANGWASGQYYSTIRFPDLNHDGKADVCGRGGGGIYCALSNGSTFGTVTLWAPSFSDGNGWGTHPYYSTIQFPDLNHDGKADVCGRGSAGINCALSNGSTFGAVSLWAPNFSDPNGWNSGQQYYSTIRFPDLNGDGKADVCGRGGGGINCALSNGSTFGTVAGWNASFSDANGWNGGPQYYSTIRFPDLNGDGKADVCGRGGAGINCAKSTGSTFGSTTLWQSSFSDANGWSDTSNYLTLQF